VVKMRNSLGPQRRMLLLTVVSVLLWGTFVSADERGMQRTEKTSGLPAEVTFEASRWPVPMPEKWIRHYYERVEEFRRENAALPKDNNNIVFVGDSITEGFPFADYFPDRPILNRGITSDGIGFDERGVLARLHESVFDCSPEVVFLLIGVNDLAHEWVTVEECLAGLVEIVERIREGVPEAKLVLQTALPSGKAYRKHAYLNPRIEEFNRGILRLARERSLPAIDCHALYADADGLLPQELTGDGLHLKKEAYAPWAQKIEPLIEQWRYQPQRTE